MNGLTPSTHALGRSGLTPAQICAATDCAHPTEWAHPCANLHRDMGAWAHPLPHLARNGFRFLRVFCPSASAGHDPSMLVRTRECRHAHAHARKQTQAHARACARMHARTHTRSSGKTISGHAFSGIDVRGMLVWVLIIRMRRTANIPCFMQLCCVAVLVSSGDKIPSCSGPAASGSCRLGPLIVCLSFDKGNSAD